MTSGSRQTLIIGEACRRACESLMQELGDQALESLNGREFVGEYLAVTDPMGAPKKNPVSHVAYGYAAQVACLNEDGTVEKVVAAHDVGRAINPLSVEGQIEGGVAISLGFALTEDFPLENGRPKARFGTLGLFRSHKTPKVHAIIVEKIKQNSRMAASGLEKSHPSQQHQPYRAHITNLMVCFVHICRLKIRHTENNHTTRAHDNFACRPC